MDKYKCREYERSNVLNTVGPKLISHQEKIIPRQGRCGINQKEYLAKKSREQSAF